MDPDAVFPRSEDRPPPMEEVGQSLVEVAARAPSLHNTQPWRFRIVDDALELLADDRRRLPASDHDGREMVMSCGAALFGVRLAVRRLGYRPEVELLPELAQPKPLARVRLGAASPLGAGERRLLRAMLRRHTHRGPFDPEPLPPGLITALQREAELEGATLVLVRDNRQYGHLATLLATTSHQHHLDPGSVAETSTWTRPPGSDRRDGVPATAYPVHASHRRGFLPQRDFDLGRGWGTPDANTAEPAATAVLLTDADAVADWMRAGEALHRVLLRAAHQWVFASLHSQVLEFPTSRAALQSILHVSAVPQMVLQFGRSKIAASTPRRPATELFT